MHFRIDPDSPVPLYHQIAEAIRAQMQRGELRAGDGLEPMRRAADQWGVNLHTVRHAYAALAREGLLEMRSARGTRVTEKARELREEPGEAVGTHCHDEGAGDFIARIVAEALERHGLRRADLLARIRDHRTSAPTVAVIECSAWQCRAHASELEARWRVLARPWPLAGDGDPEGDTLVATYFHYNDVRRRWPKLLARVRFLTIRVDPAVEAWLGDDSAVTVVERDEPTAEAVAADLQSSFRRERDLQLLVTDEPAGAIEQHPRRRLLFSPRVWSELPEDSRANARCAVVQYRFDQAELVSTAQACGWEPRSNEE